MPVLPSTLTPGQNPNDVRTNPADALNAESETAEPPRDAPAPAETPAEEEAPAPSQRSIEEFQEFLAD